MRHFPEVRQLTVIPLARVVYELIANEARSTELAMSSYTTRANGITVSVAKLSIASGHAMQIYNCLGQLRQL